MSDLEREFLDRYAADDRVVGVRFGQAMIEVQVTDSSAVSLPETFHGRPVVLRSFPGEGSPAPGGRGEARPGPLSKLLRPGL